MTRLRKNASARQVRERGSEGSVTILLLLIAAMMICVSILIALPTEAFL
jgi:hypothetical protein